MGSHPGTAASCRGAGGGGGRCVCLCLLSIAHLAAYPRSTGVFAGPGAFPHPPPLSPCSASYCSLISVADFSSFTPLLSSVLSHVRSVECVLVLCFLLSPFMLYHFHFAPQCCAEVKSLCSSAEAALSSCCSVISS